MHEFLKKFRQHIEEMEVDFATTSMGSKDIYSCLKVYESNIFRHYGDSDRDPNET